MDTPTFTTFVADERRRIHDAIKVAKAKRQEADREITQLEAQLRAINAYDAALKGTSVADKPRAARGRRGEKREAICNLLAQHTDGLTRRELLTALEVHGDKAAEQSISNALSALKKTGRIVQEGKAYKVVG